MSKITGNVKEINWVTSWQYKCINRECPICRSELEINSNNQVSIGTCGHGFHSKCLDDWYKQMNKKSCPVCNKHWVPSRYIKSKPLDKKYENNWIQYNNSVIGHINNDAWDFENNETQV